MKNEEPKVSLLGCFDVLVFLVSAIIAIVYTIKKTPPVFWISAWLIQSVALIIALVKGRSGGHWPSTIFGLVEFSYILVLLYILSAKGLSFDGLLQMFFGLLFLHGILYLVAARSFLVRKGYLKIASKSVESPSDNSSS